MIRATTDDAILGLVTVVATTTTAATMLLLLLLTLRDGIRHSLGPRPRGRSTAAGGAVAFSARRRRPSSPPVAGRILNGTVTPGGAATMLLLLSSSPLTFHLGGVRAFSGRRHAVPSAASRPPSSRSSSEPPPTTPATGGGFQSESDFPDPVRQALAAVRRACAVTRRVQDQMVSTAASASVAEGGESGESGSESGITRTKLDATPVTIADYAAQAVVLSDLIRAFPGALFLAEESSSGLREAAGAEDMTRLVGTLWREAGTDDDAVAGGDDDDDDVWGAAALERAIDLGRTYQEEMTRRRRGGADDADAVTDATLPPPDQFWCLDPIDGTKGFLRKGQYCVALALLERGVPTVGILACPNLPPSSSSQQRSDCAQGEDGRRGGHEGCIFVACKGRGCYEVGMEPSTYVRRLGGGAAAGFAGEAPRDGVDDAFACEEDPSRARFCVGVEQGFNDPDGLTVAMGEYLHGGLDVGTGEILYCTRMDSQVKYGVIARGDAEFYVRLPKSHRDNIWDVAAGALCLEEVGGKVTDLDGNPLDFSRGAKLPTVGILGARTAALHRALLEAYHKVAKPGN